MTPNEHGRIGSPDQRLAQIVPVAAALPGANVTYVTLEQPATKAAVPPRALGSQ